jgi:hypothetical protein
MPTKPHIRIQIEAAIDEHGPMSTADLAEALNIKRQQVDCALRKGRYRAEGKLFYIHAWRRQEDGHQGSMQPLYARGNKPDKPKPPRLTTQEIHARYRARHREQLRIKQLLKYPAKKRRASAPFAQLVAVATGAT